MRFAFDTSSLEDYQRFLAIKELPRYSFSGHGADVPDEYAHRIGMAIHRAADVPYTPLPSLFDYQRGISALAIRKRKYALFVRPGLGKTLMESEFARHARKCLPAHKRVLMVAPSMVVPQTIAEIQKFYGDLLPIERVRASELSDWLKAPLGGIGITNFQALSDDTPQGNLGALIIDESSALKSFSGKWAQILIRIGRGLDWKLCGTGTPAPNDRIEYANHAVFLDQYPTINSFLARFFVNRGQTQNRWEMKPHAFKPFIRSLSHWCIFMSDPGTYGWKDGAGGLPPIHIHMHDVPMSDQQRRMASEQTGTLYGSAGGISSRGVLSQIAKGHLKGEEIETHKPEYIRNLIASWPDESTLVWCLYNREQDSMEKVFPGCASIRGSTSDDARERMINDFTSGKTKVLISKPDILGFGLNLQIATRQVFSGIQDSWEDFHQCVMRSNRVGSTRPLNVHIPATFIERPMIATVMAKAKRIEADTREQESMFRELGIFDLEALTA